MRIRATYNPETIQAEINLLTHDDDERQELWVHFLNGNSVESLNQHLEDIRRVLNIDDKYNYFLEVVRSVGSQRFWRAMSNFTSFEQAVIALVIMGFNIHDISRYKSISSVRIRQLISMVECDPVWEDMRRKHD